MPVEFLLFIQIFILYVSSKVRICDNSAQNKYGLQFRQHKWLQSLLTGKVMASLAATADEASNT